MKKIIAILMLLFIGMTLFAGCSTTQTSSVENQQTSAKAQAEDNSKEKNLPYIYLYNVSNGVNISQPPEGYYGFNNNILDLSQFPISFGNYRFSYYSINNMDGLELISVIYENTEGAQMTIELIPPTTLLNQQKLKESLSSFMVPIKTEHGIIMRNQILGNIKWFSSGEFSLVGYRSNIETFTENDSDSFAALFYWMLEYFPVDEETMEEFSLKDLPKSNLPSKQVKTHIGKNILYSKNHNYSRVISTNIPIPFDGKLEEVEITYKFNYNESGSNGLLRLYFGNDLIYSTTENIVGYEKNIVNIPLLNPYDTGEYNITFILDPLTSKKSYFLIMNMSYLIIS